MAGHAAKAVELGMRSVDKTVSNRLPPRAKVEAIVNPVQGSMCINSVLCTKGHQSLFGSAMGNLTFIDLFCGIGGFRLGMGQAGFDCVFSCDINAGCQKTYLANFGEVPKGDIVSVSAEDMPDFDVLCAGFLCQPFSISGRQKGFADTRGTLFSDKTIKYQHKTKWNDIVSGK
jgi:hypothetical protein